MKDFLNRDFIENFIRIYKRTIIKVTVGMFILTLAFFVFVGRNAEGEEFELVKRNGSEISEETAPYKNSETSDSSEDEDGEKEPKEIYVDISGAVKKPYVYKLPSNSRMYELIELAGGLIEDADADSLNLAKLLTDQEKVVVYTKKEVREMAERGEIAPVTQISGMESNSGAAEKININTATVEQLQNLKGVGPSTAAKILEYRRSNGSFAKVEDLMNVKGIGQKTFEKFKEQLCI